MQSAEDWASRTVARPGFDRLVGWLCAGTVGAVLCFDASRLARNGRDWHHLQELCGYPVRLNRDNYLCVPKTKSSSVKKADFTLDWSEGWGRVRSGTDAARA
jgi:hypothetical protein